MVDPIVRVALEGDAESFGGSFPAVVRSRWNGWAVPLFDWATVDAMAASGAFCLEDGSSAVRLSADGRGWLVGSDGAADDGGTLWDAAPVVWVDGVARFAIGDGWVWLEVDAAAARLEAAIVAAAAVGFDAGSLRVDVDDLDDADEAAAVALERIAARGGVKLAESFVIRDASGRVLGTAFFDGRAL